MQHTATHRNTLQQPAKNTRFQVPEFRWRGDQPLWCLHMNESRTLHMTDSRTIFSSPWVPLAEWSNVYIHIYVYTHTHIYIYIYIYTYIYVCIFVYSHADVYHITRALHITKNRYVQIYKYAYLHTYIYICIFTGLYMYMYVYRYVYMYVYQINEPNKYLKMPSMQKYRALSSFVEK